MPKEHADSEAEALLLEWTRGWGLVAHLWNICWSLHTHAGQAAAAATSQSDDDGGEQRAPPDAFDYLSYAASRWARYLHEKDQLLHVWM